MAEENTAVNEWLRYGMKLGVSALIHPFEYSKTLMQIGYEPIPPRLGKTIFGQATLVLPNVFTYAGHIRKTDGLMGCYRGVWPKLIGNVLASYGSDKVAEKIGLDIAEPCKDEAAGDCQLEQFKRQLKRDVVIHVSSTIISHPFHVITVRMMAEFIGREAKYTSIFRSIIEIYREEGFLGFFAGFIPRVLNDVSCLVLVSASSYLFNKYLAQESETQQYFVSFSQFVFSSLFYPLHVVSTCMIVSSSGLIAGKPPNMPSFSSWIECGRHLSQTNCMKRGSSLFFRYYRPPTSGGMNAFAVAPMPEITANAKSK